MQDDPNPAAYVEDANTQSRQVPAKAGEKGASVNHDHDIKKAEREMHKQFTDARFESGQATGGTEGSGAMPGGAEVRRGLEVKVFG